MQLLLVSQQKIPSGKTSSALVTCKWFLFGVGTLVPLQMFQSSKRSSASCTNMGSRLIGFGRWYVRVDVLRSAYGFCMSLTWLPCQPRLANQSSSVTDRAHLFWMRSQPQYLLQAPLLLPQVHSGRASEPFPIDSPIQGSKDMRLPQQCAPRF